MAKQIHEEGRVFNKWIYGRMINRNQNILVATTGATGSGKSYSDLRKAELWYKHYFDEDFPIENCCFSISELVKRINSKLRRGELLIMEEAGVNLNSLDFQNRINKVFTYVLQSFRNLNIGILFNLPVLTMLNKSTRYLLHCHMITHSIDYNKNIIKLKPLFRQVNQGSGKIYEKFIRITMQGKRIPIEIFNYGMPSKELIKKYEEKKLKFVTGLTEEFSRELDELDKENMRKMARNNLTETQQEVYNYILEGKTMKEIAEIKSISVRAVYYMLDLMKKKGFEVKINRNSLENEGNEVQNPNMPPF